MSDVLKELGKAVEGGEVDRVKALIQRAVEQGVGAMDILEKSLRPAMEEVGKKFESLEIFLPEMLQAADAMMAGVGVLRPQLAAGGGEKKKGRIILGTVQGDVHKIGKDIVRIMLEGAGFEVFDLGHDVQDKTFVDKVRELQPQILGMSALMTTTMQNIPRVMQALEASGLRQNVKIIVGGAPVLPEWAEEIGADGYGENAVEAVNMSKRLVS
jgi:5-methyltetrahydrofolate--homocysteine methyltransferase